MPEATLSYFSWTIELIGIENGTGLLLEVAFLHVINKLNDIGQYISAEINKIKLKALTTALDRNQNNQKLYVYTQKPILLS